jgi:hypothetical protein
MKLQSLANLTLAACFLYSGAPLAATNRMVDVSIMNLTGEPIVAAYSHKYSHTFRDSGTTSSTTPIPMGLLQKAGKARFRTGFGTTGKDWSCKFSCDQNNGAGQHNDLHAWKSMS